MTESFAASRDAASFEPFTAEIRQRDLDDLHRRLLETRFGPSTSQLAQSRGNTASRWSGSGAW